MVILLWAFKTIAYEFSGIYIYIALNIRMFQ